MAPRRNTRGSGAKNNDNSNNNAVGLADLLTQIAAKLDARRHNDGEGSSNARRGRNVANGLSWENFKSLLTKEYYRKDEAHKLEFEFWKHQMLSTEWDKYTARFHGLAKMVPHMVSTIEKKIDRYI
nr:hypothetical protein [Tanacetum cinerariifolium]